MIAMADPYNIGHNNLLLFLTENKPACRGMERHEGMPAYGKLILYLPTHYVEPLTSDLRVAGSIHLYDSTFDKCMNMLLSLALTL